MKRAMFTSSLRGASGEDPRVLADSSPSVLAPVRQQLGCYQMRGRYFHVETKGEVSEFIVFFDYMGRRPTSQASFQRTVKRRARGQCLMTNL
jgi:hypothetical protein